MNIPKNTLNRILTENPNINKLNGFISAFALVIITLFSAISAGLIIAILKALEMPRLKEISTLLFSAMTFLWVWLYIKIIEHRSFQSLGFYIKGFFYKYIKGLGIGILLVSLSVLAISVTVPTKFTISPNFGLNGFLFLIPIFILYIIQGAGEEVLFRGWFMQSLSLRHKAFIGITVSSLLFSLMHIANNSYNVIPAVNILLIGLFLGIYMLKDGNIWGVCGIHSAWNFGMDSIWGIKVSGNAPIGQPVINTVFNGNSKLTGGNFGIEGSIVVTTIFIIALIILIFVHNGNKN
ncbi:MAG: CPBP family intramembrane metalloprotease [Bacteroidales bacterium]|nr:CPBP family intramembrane metalloprotease [Bacteroidales bacterium]